MTKALYLKKENQNTRYRTFNIVYSGSGFPYRILNFIHIFFGSLKCTLKEEAKKNKTIGHNTGF